MANQNPTNAFAVLPQLNWPATTVTTIAAYDLHFTFYLANTYFLTFLSEARTGLEGRSGYPFHFFSVIEEPRTIYVIGHWISLANHDRFGHSREFAELEQAWAPWGIRQFTANYVTNGSDLLDQFLNDFPLLHPQHVATRARQQQRAVSRDLRDILQVSPIIDLHCYDVTLRQPFHLGITGTSYHQLVEQQLNLTHMVGWVTPLDRSVEKGQVLFMAGSQDLYNEDGSLRTEFDYKRLTSVREGDWSARGLAGWPGSWVENAKLMHLRNLNITSMGLRKCNCCLPGRYFGPIINSTPGYHASGLNSNQTGKDEPDHPEPFLGDEIELVLDASTGESSSDTIGKTAPLINSLL